jgi:hypothetical protein
MSGLLFKKLAASSLLVMSVLSCQSANAAFVMTLDDLNDSAAATVISDTSGFDLNSLLGAITYSGTVGVFTVNISTAVSKPLTSSPLLSLNSINVNGSAPGNLRISITDTDYVGPVDGLLGKATKITSNTDLNVNFLVDSNNAEFSGSSFGAINNVRPFSWNTAESGYLGYTGPYSLSIIADIFHSQPSSVSNFGAEISAFNVAVPLPGALLLFLSSLGGLLAFARKKS